MNQTETTTTYCEFEKTRMITPREFMADEPHHSNLFISGLIDRIQSLSQKEAALAAGLLKLALRQDEVGEIVRREIAQAEAINVDKGNAEPPADVLKEIYFWNGIISGIELAEYQQQQQNSHETGASFERDLKPILEIIDYQDASFKSHIVLFMLAAQSKECGQALKPYLKKWAKECVSPEGIAHIVSTGYEYIGHLLSVLTQQIAVEQADNGQLQPIPETNTLQAVG